MENILEELTWRELIADCTDREAFEERLAEGPMTLYCGFDPTADSLHIGNLVPLLTLRRFQLAGHRPIALAGGATGLIGDPSGKSEERNLLDSERLEANLECIRPQLRQFLNFDDSPTSASLRNNAEWMAQMGYLEFLRDVGKRFSVNMMVAKESVRQRMEDRDAGISYTEFSYMLLQAYDFLALNRESNCELQIGGSDQWGNITAGIELCRKTDGNKVFGLTLPLITNADGSKFGKTASGAIWLAPEKTSPYRFFQYWINVDDRDVIRFLKYFTFLDREAIEGLARRHEAAPEKREAHRALASEMTSLIHGVEATEEAVRASAILFGGSLEGVQESTFLDIVGEVPSFEIASTGDGALEVSILDLLVSSGLCGSKGQARRDVQGGGVYVNNARVEDPSMTVSSNELMFDSYLLLRKGKKNYAVGQVVGAQA